MLGENGGDVALGIALDDAPIIQIEHRLSLQLDRLALFPQAVELLAGIGAIQPQIQRTVQCVHADVLPQSLRQLLLRLFF